MLARDPLGIVQVWSERLEEGKQAVVGAEVGALGALVLELKLKVHGVEDYATLMASLRVADPKMMDVAVLRTCARGCTKRRWRCTAGLIRLTKRRVLSGGGLR